MYMSARSHSSVLCLGRPQNDLLCVGIGLGDRVRAFTDKGSIVACLRLKFTVKS